MPSAVKNCQFLVAAQRHIETHRGTKRHRDTKTQRHSDTETQRPRKVPARDLSPCLVSSLLCLCVSVSLCLYVSVCPVCLYVSVSLCLSVSVRLHIPVPMCVSVCLCVSLCVSLSLCVSMTLCRCASASLRVKAQLQTFVTFLGHVLAHRQSRGDR